MTPEQIEQLADSRRTIDSRRDEIARALHEILRELDPETFALFQSGGGDGRGCNVGLLLDLLVQANEDPRRLVPVAAELGRHHASAGVHHAHYHMAGVALLRALERLLGDAFSTEVRAEWLEAFTLVSALMERAAVRTGEHPAARLPVDPSTHGEAR